MDPVLMIALGGVGVLLLVLGYGVGTRRFATALAEARQRADEVQASLDQLKRDIEAERSQWQETERRLNRQIEEEAEAREAQRRQNEERAQQLEEREGRLKSREEKLEQFESRLLKREERIERQASELQQLEQDLNADLESVSSYIEEGQSLIEGEQKRLEEISGLTQEEAKEELLRRVREDAERHYAKTVREIKERYEQEAEQEARKIIATAIQRYAAEEVELSTVSLVPLPDNDFKGRVIGREGRNIRTFEALTGVDVLVDDTPDTVVLSCFNPVRREIARVAMAKLVEDGRIHPAQIKKQVDTAQERVAQLIKEEGEKAAFEVGLEGLHQELIKMVGRLKFRTSYGQNQLQHTIEVSFIAGALAGELGIDPKSARRAGLLHDIGKGVDHKVEGPHSLISAELAWRYGESEEVVHAIAAHNNEVEPQSAMAVLLQAADALSAARPGARQETFEAYIQRLQALEDLCNSFDGVQEAYAIQAGREVRIMVQPNEIDDDMTAKLSYEVARTIEEELDYPGEIKVQVIRTTQFTERAR
ncbi:MAG: ribonuclease Y [Candidatus Bipolaricaulia bacterium]